MSDKFDLHRFIEAQAPVYAQVRAELARWTEAHALDVVHLSANRRLGQSFMARKFAISDLEEARAYFDHPVLGARLQECSRLVLDQLGRSAHDVFGSPDDIKLRSCMTLFQRVATEAPVFQEIIDAFYDGRADENTLARLPGRPQCKNALY